MFAFTTITQVLQRDKEQVYKSCTNDKEIKLTDGDPSTTCNKPVLKVMYYAQLHWEQELRSS